MALLALPAAALAQPTQSPLPPRQPAGRRTLADDLPLRVGQEQLQQAPCDDHQKRRSNNTLYELESIYDYSPEADLPNIKAHVMLINNVEDFADPPMLGTVERAFKKIAHGTYVLTPYGKDTHGHFTHYYAATWKQYLVKFISGL